MLGFGARTLRDDQLPKYRNTAEGELYHKRAQLFGIDLARAAATRAGRVILVEGYTDVLALHQAGLRNAVGIMGTSLTEEQVHALERIGRRCWSFVSMPTAPARTRWCAPPRSSGADAWSCG